MRTEIFVFDKNKQVRLMFCCRFHLNLKIIFALILGSKYMMINWLFLYIMYTWDVWGGGYFLGRHYEINGCQRIISLLVHVWHVHFYSMSRQSSNHFHCLSANTRKVQMYLVCIVCNCIIFHSTLFKLYIVIAHLCTLKICTSYFGQIWSIRKAIPCV